MSNSDRRHGRALPAGWVGKGEPRWFAVHCQANRENLAAANLAEQGYGTFLPRYRKLRRHARRVDKVLRPFFPNYLFVRLDMDHDRWRPINGTSGVARLVMCGDRPVPAPVGVVEVLQRSCDEAGVMTWRPDLIPGQAVRVNEGPFAGLVGELESLRGNERVRVLLDLMGSSVPAMLPRASVMPADSLV